MHRQLQAIVQEFQRAGERLEALHREVPETRWPVRSDPNRWSVSECVAHLNLTSEEYLPVLRGAVEEARTLDGGPPARYRRDPIGWILWKTMGPPVRMRMKTAAAFIPEATAPVDELIATFRRLQQEQIECVAAADGLPIQKVKVESPFDRRVRYNLYACFTIITAHQHRHLWQAEQAR